MKEVEPLMWAVNHAMQMRSRIYPRLAVSFDKYSSEYVFVSLKNDCCKSGRVKGIALYVKRVQMRVFSVFFEVTSFPFLDDRFPPSVPVGPPSEFLLKDY